MEPLPYETPLPKPTWTPDRVLACSALVVVGVAFLPPSARAGVNDWAVRHPVGERLVLIGLAVALLLHVTTAGIRLKQSLRVRRVGPFLAFAVVVDGYVLVSLAILYSSSRF